MRSFVCLFDQDVGRLEIAVGHATVVRQCHGCQNLFKQAQPGALVGAFQCPINGLALDQVHGDVVATKDAHRSGWTGRMWGCSKSLLGFSFADHPGDGTGLFGLQVLDGDVARERGAPGTDDFGLSHR